MTTYQRTATAIATVLIAAIAIVAAILATSSTDTDWTRGYEPCATEDAAGPCYWDAETQGNGEGRSFVVEPDGQVIYVER